jgi:hypothetical protein
MSGTLIQVCIDGLMSGLILIVNRAEEVCAECKTEGVHALGVPDRISPLLGLMELPIKTVNKFRSGDGMGEDA